MYLKHVPCFFHIFYLFSCCFLILRFFLTQDIGTQMKIDIVDFLHVVFIIEIKSKYFNL